ncbi:hypothetical protein EDB94_0558 [Marinobacter sp. 3-2]|nr:hypothetical protein EDB94_0558 [Marinobacter sp. 3-2]
MCESAVGFPFPKNATSTSMCAWLWPSLATDIFGKGNPTPSFRMLQFSRRDSFSSIETYKVATNTRVIGSFAKRFWAGLTGMSLAMDGQRQAHMDVLVAFPVSPAQKRANAETVRLQEREQDQSQRSARLPRAISVICAQSLAATTSAGVNQVPPTAWTLPSAR